MQPLALGSLAAQGTEEDAMQLAAETNMKGVASNGQTNTLAELFTQLLDAFRDQRIPFIGSERPARQILICASLGEEQADQSPECRSKLDCPGESREGLID